MVSSIGFSSKVRYPIFDLGMTNKKRPSRPLSLKFLFLHAFFITCGWTVSPIVRRGLLRNTGGFDCLPTLVGVPDHDFKKRSKLVLPFEYKPAKISKIPP